MSDYKSNEIVIGVTGGIACGKSEVGRILEEMGFVMCDADLVAHEVMKHGTPVFRRIVEHFGETILSDNGEISRPLLGQLIFEDPEERKILNELVHPAVRDVLADWIADKKKQGKNAAVQIPLLYESGMESLDWDAVVCISSSEETMIERLLTRGLSRKDAELRIASQMPLSEKETRADLVVPNSGTFKELEKATRGIIESIAVER